MSHSVEIADHLWAVLEAMAKDMSTDPRSLVNQAVFNWARRNGYPVVSLGSDAPKSLPVPAPEPPRAETLRASLVEPVKSALVDAAKPTIEATKPAPVAAVKPTAPETAKPALVEAAEPSSVEAATPTPVATPKPAPAPRPAPDPEGKTAEMPRPILSPAKASLAASRPTAVTDEATAFAEPASVSAIASHQREPLDELSVARNSVAARIVAIDRALDAILPTPGRLNRARMGTGELDGLVGNADKRPTIDTSPTPVPRFILELHLEGTSERVIVDSSPVIIGRAKHCNLVIESPLVSREHAIVVRDGSNYIIEDRGSSNGTFIGQDQVQRRELCDGDVCHIGTASLRVSIRAA